MPSGIYIRTHTGKPGNRLGKHHSEESKKRMSSAAKGKIVSKETRLKLSNGAKGRILSEETKAKISEAHKGKPFSEEHIRNLSKAHIGVPQGPHSKEHIRKIRLAAIKRIEKNQLNGNQLVPFYNPKSISIIDEYGRTHGYSFQHAENGGEFYIKTLGYWVDGYDKTKNVVIEYYEIRHKGSINRDEKRKQEIIKQLGCEFIIIKEWENNRTNV